MGRGPCLQDRRQDVRRPQRPARRRAALVLESFEILINLDGIIPAPYLARAKWVRFDKPQRLPTPELKAYLTRARTLVAANLPKKKQKELGLTG